jgi:hypothetical protein
MELLGRLIWLSKKKEGKKQQRKESKGTVQNHKKSKRRKAKEGNQKLACLHIWCAQAF